MEYVRLLHPNHFDCQRDEFKSLAFKVYDDGASVIQLDCIVGHGICDHIRQYYRNVGGEPPVFWIFDEAILPADSRLVQKRSESGDDCHFNIIADNVNALNKALRKLLKSQRVETFHICDDGQHRQLKRTDVCPSERKVVDASTLAA